MSCRILPVAILQLSNCTKMCTFAKFNHRHECTHTYTVVMSALPQSVLDHTNRAQNRAI